MAKYSNDSDSDQSGKYRKMQSRRRSRSSSSSSSDSSSYQKRSSKHSKKRHRRDRSRNRDSSRSRPSYRSSPGSSKDHDRRRYKSKRSPSTDRSKTKRRSTSREKSRSRSTSSQSCVKFPDRTLTVKDEFSIEPRMKEKILEEINADSFAPKQFISSANSKEGKNSKSIVIDITADSIQVPNIPEPPNISSTIFHSSITNDQEARFDKWVKKLYNLRQKAMAEII